ncbi:MAG: heme lyase CcmF/NrfE family subunit [Porticoccaceae bacterium]|jgi:cytochrome c-type biogenesis protein CcmF
MTPELGHVALIIALCFALAQAAVPMVGSFSGHNSWMRLGHSLALGQFVFIALSFACLANAFLQDDFSVAYVANNSNTLLPDRFKFSAVWGAHEGSLLLWVLMLAGWSAAVALYSRELPAQLVARVLSILGFVAIGFIVFLLLTSNPFDRLLPVSPVEGRDLNPLLQDFGLIVHPPMLYMGYVGFAVPFAFAIAALIGSQFDSAWARWARPWINVAWAFLTIGIGLGSWWAYYELGWGGWWFWDPVENASFMPWLVGTALVHSISATEKRGVFRSWTLLLAIFAFSLSLLGAFLVRSGILTSVHAFASDPERGAFILGFITLVIGGSLTLFALRGPAIQKVAGYGAWSREMMLLLNNILLVSSMAMILVGTLYPLLADVLNLGKISVGPPYFNFFFVPLMSGLAIAVGFAAFTRWKKTDPGLLRNRAVAPALISLVLALVLPLFLASEISWSSYSLGAVFTLLIGLWVITMTARDLVDKTAGKWARLRRLSGSYWGMVVAHVGLAVCVLGVGLSSVYSMQRDVRMEPGDRIQVAGYEFEFVAVTQVQGPNYIAYRGEINVEQQGSRVATMLPEKRNYRAGGQIMTEAAIDAALHRDLYVSLGEPLAGQAWAVRLYVKPFVRCIWLGALMIALGGLLAAGDKRYRRRVGWQKTASDNAGALAKAAS